MKVDRDSLSRFLVLPSFQWNGDEHEQAYGHLLSDSFPNCENYWKSFVVPLTTRMQGYPTALSQTIGFRQDISPGLQDISAVHYSVFLKLAYAHLYLGYTKLSWVENFYVTLGSVCDLAETFLEKWYLLLLKCRGEQARVLQCLTREEFLDLAGEWYDKHYSTLYGYYQAKGKPPPLRLPLRGHLLKECFEEYLREPNPWKSYTANSQTIREFRNVIVHDVQVGQILSPDGDILIPKPKAIQRYRTWREVFTAANDRGKIQQDFVKASHQAKEDLESLEMILNQLWEITIRECESEFYSQQRVELREMYAIEF